MAGATVTSAGTMTMDHSTYKPIGTPLIFQVSCGSKVSNDMSITVCNTGALGAITETFIADGSFGID